MPNQLQKRQHNEGQYKAMKYFMQDDFKRLSWSALLFNNEKVDSYDFLKPMSVENSCHHKLDQNFKDSQTYAIIRSDYLKLVEKKIS